MPSPPARPLSELGLSLLRPLLDADSDGATWLLNPDGIMGRALVAPKGTAITYRFALPVPVQLHTRAALFPHDWRDGRGSVQAAVDVTAANRRRREAWSGALHTGDRGRPTGAEVALELPAGNCEVRFRHEFVGELVTNAVTRMVWIAPRLTGRLPELAGNWPRPAPPAGDLPATTTGEPLISVLVPVHDPAPHMLQEAVASVRGQTFGDWQLVLVDDGSRDPRIVAALERHAASDPRIALARQEVAGGISAATNRALSLARGRYVALLDHDDMLAPDALEHVAARLVAEPELDMLYSDEDTVDDEGRRIGVHHKPAWSPDTLRTNGYTCHLGVYRRELVEAVGAFRTEFNGSQDVDLILRLTERTDRIAHIPRVLYHWRAHAGSTAAGYAAKPYAYVAARNAIAEHLRRSELDAEVTFGPPGLYRVTHSVDSDSAIDLALAVTSLQGLDEALAGWATQPHQRWRLLLAVPPELEQAAAGLLRNPGAGHDRVHLLTAEPGIDPGLALTAAAAAGDADTVLLLHRPVTGVTHDWLTRLIGYAREPGIDAAGPVVLAADGRILQGGIALPEGLPIHLLHGARSSMDRHFGYGTSVYNVSAVGGALATRRATFRSAGGLRAGFSDLALADYCLRCAGRVVIVPDARLRLTVADDTANDLVALARLREAWTQGPAADPYYNPNFRVDHGDFAPA